MAQQFNLPGGSRTLRGENSQSLTDEQYRQRQQEQGRRDNWYIEVGGVERPGTACLAGTSTFILVPMFVPETIRVRYARIWVETGDANGVTKTAIYYCPRDKYTTIRQYPHTEATYDCTTAGMKQVELTKEAYILPEKQNFLGFWSSAKFIVLYGVDATNNLLIRPRRLLDQTDLLPSFELETLTLDSEIEYPLCAYLSTEAAKVF